MAKNATLFFCKFEIYKKESQKCLAKDQKSEGFLMFNTIIFNKNFFQSCFWKLLRGLKSNYIFDIFNLYRIYTCMAFSFLSLSRLRSKYLWHFTFFGKVQYKRLKGRPCNAYYYVDIFMCILRGSFFW